MSVKFLRKPVWAGASLVGLVIVGLLAARQLVPRTSGPKTVTIGVVNFVPTMEPILEAFKAEMTVLGYREGTNITYIYHGPVASEMLDDEARTVLGQGVDLILSLSTLASQAACQAAAEAQVPVVFVPVTDPVAAGIVDSLRSPGRHCTGITNGGSDGRRLEWLIKAAAPMVIKRVYVAYNSGDASPRSALEALTGAADKLGVELVSQAATNSAEMLAALDAMPADVDAIFMLPDALAISHIADFVAAANTHRLPMSGPTTTQVAAGAFMTYGIDFPAGGRQAARLADQILQGVRPADLPVEVGEFTLAINLKTAEEIGLTVPADILEQADEIVRP